jgi:hypothetical protein
LKHQVKVKVVRLQAIRSRFKVTQQALQGFEQWTLLLVALLAEGAQAQGPGPAAADQAQRQPVQGCLVCFIFVSVAPGSPAGQRRLSTSGWVSGW